MPELTEAGRKVWGKQCYPSAPITTLREAMEAPPSGITYGESLVQAALTGILSGKLNIDFTIIEAERQEAGYQMWSKGLMAMQLT